tara:strand:- start:2989 stop:3981 length:993 start_codon:yes stop_codon:yes gene_type:complete
MSRASVISRSTGTYPGIINDVGEALSVDDVIEMVPEIGYEVEKTDCFMEVDGHFRKIKNRSIIRNVETSAPYGIATSAYGLQQYKSVFSICDSLASFGATFDQCGILAGGGSAWISMSMPEETIMQEEGVDVLVPKLLVFGDHTTASANKLLSFIGRIACNNQLPGLANQSKGAISIHHRRFIEERFSMAKCLVEESSKNVSATLEIYRSMAHCKMDRKSFRTFSENLLDDHRGKSVRESKHGQEVTHGKRAADIEELDRYFGLGNQGAGETIWGAYQSVTAWLDHKAERMDQSKATVKKLESMWKSNTMGDGNRLKNRAFKRLRNIVSR